MYYIIAHRGNTNGPNPALENTPEYLIHTLKQGYHVETDVWFVEGKWRLGHDIPMYPVSTDLLKNPYVICHAKTPETLAKLLEMDCHCFFHDKDEVVLTSKNLLWTFPGGRLTSNSIAVMPELTTGWYTNSCRGVCTDYVSKVNQKAHLAVIVQNNPKFTEFGFNKSSYLLPVRKFGPSVVYSMVARLSLNYEDCTVICDQESADELKPLLDFEPNFVITDNPDSTEAFDSINFADSKIVIASCSLHSNIIKTYTTGSFPISYNSKEEMYNAFKSPPLSQTPIVSDLEELTPYIDTPERYLTHTFDDIGPIRYSGDRLKLDGLTICVQELGNVSNWNIVLYDDPVLGLTISESRRVGNHKYVKFGFRSKVFEGFNGMLQLSNTIRGWFIGNFFPSFIRTEKFEIGYLTHEAGESWDAHIHEKTHEYNYLASGRMLINNEEYNTGDWFIFPAGHLAVPKFVEKCNILCIKMPSVPGDKRKY